MKRKIETVDEYLASAAPNAKEPLARMRETIRAAAPKAEECISYQIPAFRQDGILVYYGAFKNHISLFPGNVELIRSEFKDELKNYMTSKGTIQFPIDQRLPATLIKKIVKVRIKDNQEKAAAKVKKSARR